LFMIESATSPGRLRRHIQCAREARPARPADQCFAQGASGFAGTFNMRAKRDAPERANAPAGFARDFF
jgi:hypothetical protein